MSLAVADILYAIQQQRMYQAAMDRESEWLAQRHLAQSWNEVMIDSFYGLRSNEAKSCYFVDVNLLKFQEIGLPKNAEVYGMLAKPKFDYYCLAFQRLCNSTNQKTNGSPYHLRNKDLLYIFENHFVPTLSQGILYTLPLAMADHCGSVLELISLFSTLPSATMMGDNHDTGILSASFCLAFITGEVRFSRELMCHAQFPNFDQRCHIIRQLLGVCRNSNRRKHLNQVTTCFADVMTNVCTLVRQQDLHAVNVEFVLPVMKKIRELGHIDMLYERFCDSPDTIEEWLVQLPANIPSDGDRPNFQAVEYDLKEKCDMLGNSALNFLVVGCENSLSSEFRTNLYDEYQKIPYIKAVGMRKGSLINVVAIDDTVIPSDTYFPIGSLGPSPVWYSATKAWPMQKKLSEIAIFMDQIITIAQKRGVAQNASIRSMVVPDWNINISVTTVNPPSLSFARHSDACPTNTVMPGENAIDVHLPPPELLRTLTFVTVSESQSQNIDAKFKLDVTAEDKRTHKCTATNRGIKHVSFGCGDHWQWEGSQTSTVCHAAVPVSGSSRTANVIRYVTTFRRIVLPEFREPDGNGYALTVGDLSDCCYRGRFPPTISLKKRLQQIKERTVREPRFVDDYYTFRNGANSVIIAEKVSPEDEVQYFPITGEQQRTQPVAVLCNTRELEDDEFTQLLLVYWSSFQFSVRTDTVANVPREVFDQFGLSMPVGQCRTAAPASEILCHHRVIKGLFDKPEAYVPFVVWSKRWPENLPVPMLPVQTDGKLYRVGDLYGSLSVFLRAGILVKVASRSCPFFRSKEEPFANIMVLSRNYKSKLDSILSLWEWALSQADNKFDSPIPFPEDYNGSFESFLGGGSHQPTDQYNPDIRKVASTFIISNGQSLLNGSNRNFMEAFRKGSVVACFLDVVSFSKGLAETATEAYPMVHCMRERIRSSDLKPDEELLFINYFYPGSVTFVPERDNDIMSGLGSTFLTGPHGCFSMLPFAFPEDWVVWLHREETSEQPITKLTYDNDTCGHMVLPLNKGQMKLMKNGKSCIKIEDFHDFAIAGDFLRYTTEKKSVQDNDYPTDDEISTILGDDAADDCGNNFDYSSRNKLIGYKNEVHTYFMKFHNIMCETNVAGAMRFFGRNIVNFDGVVCAQPLRDQSLGDIHRTHPMPLAQRELDTIPTAVLTIALDLRICSTDSQHCANINRLLVNKKEDMQTKDCVTLIANCLLLRISGNLKRMIGYNRWKQHIKTMINCGNCQPLPESLCRFLQTTGKEVTFGIATASPSELELYSTYAYFVHDVITTNEARKRKVTKLINQQHTGAIPFAISQSVYHYKLFVMDGVRLFPEALVTAWEKTTKLTGCQSAHFVKMLVEFVRTTCNSFGKGRETDFQFLGQQLYLDLCQVFDFQFTSCAIHNQVEQKRSKAPVNDNVRRNIAAYPPELVYLHAGSRQALDYIRGHLHPDCQCIRDMFTAYLEVLDSTDTHGLSMLGIVRENDDLYKNHTTGDVFTALHFEHMLCKLSIFLKADGGYTVSEQPMLDKGYTYPTTIGDAGAETVMSYNNYPPIVKAMSRILNGYDHSKKVGNLKSEWDENIFGKECRTNEN